MSSLAASPQASASLEHMPQHPAHSQIQQFHPAIPTVSQSTLTSSAMGTPGTAIETMESASSAGYFGFRVDPSDPAHTQHSLRNWSPASSIRSAAARSPIPVHLENPSTPFQQQAEILAHRLQHPPNIRRRFDNVHGGVEGAINGQPTAETVATSAPRNDYFSSATTSSPFPVHPAANEPWAVNSPPSTLHLPPSPGLYRPVVSQRPSISTPRKDGDPIVITPEKLSEFLAGSSTTSLLLLDVRSPKAHAVSRIKSSVNLCIPTTLLKRPSFNIAKMSETFGDKKDQEKFGNWKSMSRIVVYDDDSEDPAGAKGLVALHTMSKFSREGWDGKVYMLKGGFATFSEKYPEQIDNSHGDKSAGPKKLTLNGVTTTAEKVQGGVFNCPLPTDQAVVNPFFSNIRQNMDLIGGVGEIAVQFPTSMGSEATRQLPAWLKEVADTKKGPKLVAERFLQIEKDEQKRMQDALNVSVLYDSPTSTTQKPHTLAGVEKGAKNRYNNIWPYDHSRVKLQDFPREECDYVNASHVAARNGRKRYIASQAPLPATFRDFWNMVWEQDVRVIVMLTAEEEGGRLKCHNYWKSGMYGSLTLNMVTEQKVSLDPSFLKGGPKRRSLSSTGQQSAADASVPFITVRTFTLQHEGQPFVPMRQITQLQYSGWPDFGAPAHPAHVLALVEHTDAVVRSTSPESTRRPVLVHCSAGCGRTGAFCTIDSVISMMKRQRTHQRRKRLHQQQQSQSHHEESSDGDSITGHTNGSSLRRLDLGEEDEDDDWMERDDEDLIFKAVCDFRDQRISMVQCLRQYVLCYEAVLEWLAKQNPVDSGKRKA